MPSSKRKSLQSRTLRILCEDSRSTQTSVAALCMRDASVFFRSLCVEFPLCGSFCIFYFCFSVKTSRKFDYFFKKVTQSYGVVISSVVFLEVGGCFSEFPFPAVETEHAQLTWLLYEASFLYAVQLHCFCCNKTSRMVFVVQLVTFFFVNSCLTN